MKPLYKFLFWIFPILVVAFGGLLIYLAGFSAGQESVVIPPAKIIVITCVGTGNVEMYFSHAVYTEKDEEAIGDPIKRCYAFDPPSPEIAATSTKQ
jgi:hypothetical protein